MNPTQKPDTTAAALADLTPAVILRCAARYLELHGWIQDSYHQPNTTDPFPPACAVGAISMAIYGYRDAVPSDRTTALSAAWRLLERTIRVLDNHIDATEDLPGELDGDTPYGDPVSYGWNDLPCQTRERVIAALRTAADDYDRTHGGTR
ncbi:DUF6197 family protein [Plantactinospora sp. WMMB334]|uniref:DUF6197 family protein n=1 Tax=Plantactinospora sp. WMMB334 TaxID=3404119 RepID=UPI003B9270AF